jgi:hypothetical protein
MDGQGLALAFACVFSSRTSPATLLCQRAVVPSPRAEEVLAAMSIEIRKLSREEAARAFPKRGQMDLSAYTAALADLTPGDAAVVDLDGTTSRAMKRRLGQAATQLGYRLRWARQSDPAALHFEVLPTRARSSGAPVAGAGSRWRRRRPAEPQPAVSEALVAQPAPGRTGDGVPYQFTPTDRVATTVEEFLVVCRAEPVVVTEHLQRGYFEAWLRLLARPDLAALAGEIRERGEEPGAGLERLLRAAAPAQQRAGARRAPAAQPSMRGRQVPRPAVGEPATPGPSEAATGEPVTRRQRGRRIQAVTAPSAAPPVESPPAVERRGRRARRSE